jgi:hypothetical protein
MWIQSRVVSRSGLDLASSCLMHLNRNYVRGTSLDVRRLFSIRNLTRRVARLQPKLTFQLRAEHTVLSLPAEGSRKCPRLPVHGARHVRVLRPLQSSAAGGGPRNG